jgi:hypothetical protein
MYIYEDATAFQLISGEQGCAVVANNGTADGSRVGNAYCGNKNEAPASIWKSGANGSVFNVQSNKCLQTVGGASTPNTQLEIRTCDGSAAQRWTLPADTGVTPATPKNLRAVTGGSNIALQWDVPENPYVNQYNVYRNGAKIGITNANDYNGPELFGTSYIDAAVTAGTAYSYQVQAVDNLGNLSALSPVISASRPTAGIADPSIIIDSSITRYAPDMLPWLQNIGVRNVKTWYAKAANKLAYPDYAPPNSLTIKTEPESWWVANKPNYSALVYYDQIPASLYIRESHVASTTRYMSEAIVHESVHNISEIRNWTTVPLWLAEGQSEYVGQYMMNAFPSVTNKPVGPVAPIDASEFARTTPYAFYATEGYEQAALMMHYVEKTYDPNYVHKLNVAARRDAVPVSLMQFADGTTVDQAYKTAAGYPARVGGMRNGASNRCVDADATAGMREGAKIQIWDCNGLLQQKVGVHAVMEDGSTAITAHGKCLTVNNGSTANQTPVVLKDCLNPYFDLARSKSQLWTISGNKLMSRVAANKCLEPAGGGTANATGLQIYTCNGGNWQNWTLP